VIYNYFMEGQKKYIAAIGEFPKISSEVWQKLTAYFGSYQKAWEATRSNLVKAGLKSEVAADFVSYAQGSDPDMVWDKYQKYNIDVVTLNDGGYPRLLKEIANPPFVLYIRGELKPQDENAIAIVGSRKATDYGRRATREVAEGLATAGVTIVSGLALGLDAEAQEAALKAGGRTVAVLANGLEQICPHSNYALGLEVIKNGALISEYPIGKLVFKPNFPARNRIVSGISQGVLITEAGEHSGTLHTANFAIEQNRQVYAIPGPIYNPLAKGPNDLLKLGAKAVTCAADILEDFGIEENLIELKPSNDNERLIFRILENEPKHIDDISTEANRPGHEVSQILTLMEIKGKVRHLGGMVYSLRK
jgi:DNA processing protein